MVTRFVPEQLRWTILRGTKRTCEVDGWQMLTGVNLLANVDWRQLSAGAGEATMEGDVSEGHHERRQPSKQGTPPCEA